MPDTLTRREARLAVQRRASIPSSYDAEAHTVDLTAATGTRVLRYSWVRDGYYWEVLDISAEAVDLGRIEAGQCPMLDTHSRWSVKDQLGTVEGGRIEGGQLILSTRFGDSDAAREAEGDVAAGTLKGVSIGYRITELTLTEHKEGDYPVYTATRWELLEVSLCPVPADPAAGVRSDDGLHPCVILETRSMPPEQNPAAAPATPEAQTRVAPAAPAAAPGQAEQRTEPLAPSAAQPAPDASAARMSPGEAIDFIESARTFGLDVTQARTWATDMTPDAARSALLQAAAERQRGETPRVPAGEGARVTHDARDKVREAASLALLHRFDPDNHQLSGDVGAGAREWSGMSLLEMGRRNLEANGVRIGGMNRRELAGLMLGMNPDGSRAHTTSDFPMILSNVTGRTLRSGYESAPQTFRAWMRRATAPDFKQISRLQLGGAPAFLLVPEGGEFKMGTVDEAKEVYSLATYGRRFAITRQTIINDDLDAFSRIPTMFGRAAADFESDAAYAPIIANPNMGDGVPLFHANHGNLAAAGAAPSETTLAAGQQAMGEQTGIEGRYINVQPKHLIVGWKHAVTSQKLLTAVQATATSGVNVFANKLNLIVEARLKAAPQPWFMAADYAQIDTLEYCYLEGDEGVYLEERMGFEVDGIEYKARTDFAVKAIDHRGVYKNPGDN